MVYVKRDSEGRITGVSVEEAPGFEAADASLDAEVADFLAANSPSGELVTSDLEFVRVVDDLLEVLIDKGVIAFTDLPDQAQQKFLRRGELRQRRRESLDLLDDESYLIPTDG